MVDRTYIIIGLTVVALALFAFVFYRFSAKEGDMAPIPTAPIPTAPIPMAPIPMARTSPIIRMAPMARPRIVSMTPMAPKAPMAPMVSRDKFTLHLNKWCKDNHIRSFWGETDKHDVLTSEAYKTAATDCARECLDNPACNSFQISPDKKLCQLSSTCNAGVATDRPKWLLYTRN